MKIFFKIIFMIIVIFVLLSAAETIFKFRVSEIISHFLGGSKLESVRVNIGQEVITPIFQIASLEIFYPKVIGMMDISKKEWWKLNIGTVFVIVEYDSYAKFGIRDPHSIKMEKIGDTVYVDTSTINIELLDTKLSNFQYVRTFTSNPLVMNNNIEQHIFDSINLMESELIIKMHENGQSNFEYAKRNFMDNYRNLCRSMGLEVVYRDNIIPDLVY